MNKNKLSLIVAGLLTGGSFPVSSQVLVEQITVTAQKREQGVQDVGIAISAFSGDQMESLGMDSSMDIIALVPSVHVGGNVGGQSQQYTVRGVTQNDFSDHTEAPIAAYIDDTYILSTQGQKFALFDLERVEVLKGPQGTLFGRNATGGLVHFISRKPTVETEGYFKIEYGDYDRIKSDGAIGGSLSENVRGRIAGTFSTQNAYLKNDYDPNSPEAFNPAPELIEAGSGEDFGAETNSAIRGHLEIDFSEFGNILLSANWAESEMSSAPYQSVPTSAIYDADGNQINAIRVTPNQTALHFTADGLSVGLRPVPGGDITGYIDPDGVGLGTTSSDYAFEDLNSIDAWGTSATVNYYLSSGAQITLISDYKSMEKFIGADIDAAPVNQLGFAAIADVKQFSQEIRLSSNTDNSNWILGAYYLKGDYDNSNGFKVFTNAELVLPPGTVVGDYPAEVEQTVRSLSIFGQIEYALTDDFTLIGGVRVVEDEKEFDYALNYRTPSSPRDYATGLLIADFGTIAGLPFQTTFTGDSSDTFWTGKLQLDWRPKDGLLLYAGINRGVKGGGFNAPIDFGGSQLLSDFSYEYDEEVLISYEAGFKTEMFNGLGILNGSVYYYDYQDYQAFVFANVSGVVLNADASVIGGEIEFKTSPIAGLDIALGIGAFDATVKDVAIAVGVVKDVKPSFAPELSLSGLVRYAWEVDSGELATQLSFSYTDDFFYSLRNFDSTKVENYTLLNARVSYTSASEKWELAAFIDNITDEQYEVLGYDLSPFCGCSETTTGNPRWWGISYKYFL
jgi:iron complex outermembrane receptor protein